MTFTTLAVTYVLGGLTFLPLLLTAVLLPAWLLLPRVSKTGDGAGYTGVLDEEDKASKEALLAAQKDNYDAGNTADGAASGTFAVLRSHHFPSALAALNAKSGGGGGNGGSNGSTDGTVEAGVNSESVYQSMYRSVFDRRKDASTASSVLENAPADGSMAAGSASRVKRKPVGASIFYIVLRHGHLMLYDSPAQLEVRHVISLAHHSISLSEGGAPDGEGGPIMEADLFIKRTAIVLTPTHIPNGLQQLKAAQPKPFYLFSSTCSEKEDFYHALLSTRVRPPIPQPLSAENIIKLQSTLHSTSLTPETRAFDALIGRIFLAIHRTPVAESFIRSKIEKKIARVQKPAFIASLAVKSIDLGDAAPVLSNPRLKDINISGDMTIAFDIRYNGCFQVVIAAVAKLDLGTRFKARTVDVVLATSLQRMSAHVLVRIKPPPSSRIWFCFESAPEMEIKVEPVVSSRQITYTFILRAIEERIRGVITETLVKPNWDDVPFFDTRAQKVRGGIWADEGGEAVGSQKEKVAGVGETADALASAAAAAVRLGGRNEKTMSMPALGTTDAVGTDAFTVSSGADAATSSALKEPQLNPLKRRSVASLPLQRAGTSNLASPAPENLRAPMAPPPKPLRSPSFTSPPPSAPSVAVDGAYGLPVRSDDATLQPPPASKWRSRSSLQTQQARRPMEAVEAVREMRDRTAVPLAAQDDSTNTAPVNDEQAAIPPVDVPSAEPSELDVEGMDINEDEEDGDDRAPWSGTPSLVDSDQVSTGSSKSGAQRRAEQRKNILAATAAATTAAKNWSWNAIANARTRQQQGNGSGRGVQSTDARAHLPPQPRNTIPPPAAPSSSSLASPAAAHSEQQPIGRGKPLPPPGTPLPGPDRPPPKSLWSTAAGLASGASVKRRPVLPPRRTGSVRSVGAGPHVQENGVTSGTLGGQAELLQNVAKSGSTYSEREVGGHHGEEEFGPWNENSGVGAVVEEEFADANRDGGEAVEDISAVVTPLDFGAEAAELGVEGGGEPVSTAHDIEPAARLPPPLPPRRRAGHAAQAQRPENVPAEEQKDVADIVAASANGSAESSHGYSPATVASDHETESDDGGDSASKRSAGLVDEHTTDPRAEVHGPPQ
ncbi:hypothetical protein LTR36_009064 [Oleoguttula mirabilis]|uniref:SMP-LTD domain-containing protein n=1 Tax=Oleoguttula mirabilis TaxID=1507867 RepID=A0AAV9J7B5_9PEZI|nr:hypothetical protein LTR36_009064 [Oleoguttula mirabilis]